MLVLSGLTCQAHNPMSINSSEQNKLFSTTIFATRVASPMLGDQTLSTLAHAISNATKDSGLTVLNVDKNSFAEITLLQQKNLQNKLHNLFIQPVKIADWGDRI